MHSNGHELLLVANPGRDGNLAITSEQGMVWNVQIYGLALPLILIAIFVGDKLNRHIPTARFERLL